MRGKTLESESVAGTHAWLLGLIAALGCGTPDGPPDPDPDPKIDILVVRAQLDTIYVGDATQVSAEAVDTAGAPIQDLAATWSTTDTAIVRIIPDNDVFIRVAGRRTGTAVVRGEAGGVSDTALVVVRERVATVTIQPRPLSLIIGDTVQFEAVLKDTAGLTLTGRPVLWGASAAGAEQVVIESTGRLAVDAGGTTTVEATAEGITDQLTIALVTDGPLTELAVGEDFGCGLSSQQTAYCWGWNGWGELGGGTVRDTRYWAMRRVAGSTPFTLVSARTKSACALSSTGEPSCWGFDDVGQLGNPAGEQPCFLGPCRGSPMPVLGAPAFGQPVARRLARMRPYTSRRGLLLGRECRRTARNRLQRRHPARCRGSHGRAQLLRHCGGTDPYLCPRCRRRVVLG